MVKVVVFKVEGRIATTGEGNPARLYRIQDLILKTVVHCVVTTFDMLCCLWKQSLLAA